MMEVAYKQKEIIEKEVINKISKENLEILYKNTLLKKDIEELRTTCSWGFRQLITIASLKKGSKVGVELICNLDSQNIDLALELINKNKLILTKEAKIIMDKFNV